MALDVSAPTSPLAATSVKRRGSAAVTTAANTTTTTTKSGNATSKTRRSTSGTSDSADTPGAGSDDNDQDDSATRSTSPDSVMDDDVTGNGDDDDDAATPPTSDSTPPPTHHKRSKPASRAPIATGISTTIPVTGEKPRPSQSDNSQLEDDVLFAIFLILYEKDPEGQGMTVKQICDVLVAQHPEMASLSTKTSNLVSAKLNAYVKRVEKGDVNLKYALSREWKDASPKRMVYVYRGLLTSDFHLHLARAGSDVGSGVGTSSASSSAASARASSPAASAKLAPASRAHGASGDDSLESTKYAAINKPRRQTMWDLGVTRHTFSDPDKSHLFVPYSVAPVAAAFTSSAPGATSLAPGARGGAHSGGGASGSGGDGAASDAEDLFSDDDMVLFDVDVFNKHGKRSKSMSALGLKKRPLTAAAAAPRAPRAPSQHSPTAAAAAAALHAAALKAISASTAALQATVAAAPSPSQPWLRPGVLSQDIGAPEDTSLSDIDKFFA